MKRTLLTIGAALIAATTLSAQTSTQQAPPATAPAPAPAAAKASVAGNWTITIDAGNGPMEVYATMKLDGKKVTGNLSSQMGDTPLEGEFADGKVTFVINFDGGGGAMQLNWIGMMKDADHLTGTMSGPMGEIPWTAIRAKG
jgi:hypothetical protein